MMYEALLTFMTCKFFKLCNICNSLPNL